MTVAAGTVAGHPDGVAVVLIDVPDSKIRINKCVRVRKRPLWYVLRNGHFMLSLRGGVFSVASRPLC